MSNLVLALRHLIGQTSIMVDIRDGVPEAKKGRVPNGFLEDCKDVIDQAGIKRGRVYGFADGRRTSLAFSSHFGASSQQRLRNAWCFHEK